MEDHVRQKRDRHRPRNEVVSKQEMVDRMTAAVDARADDGFVIMARVDTGGPLWCEALDTAD
jgi:methylisocitrate lyase